MHKTKEYIAPDEGSPTDMVKNISYVASGERSTIVMYKNEAYITCDEGSDIDIPKTKEPVTCDDESDVDIHKNKEHVASDEVSEEQVVNNSTFTNTNSTSQEMSIDQFLELIGDFGKGQKLIILLISIMVAPPFYQFLIMVFIGYNPPWRCGSQKNMSTNCGTNGTTFALGDDFYKQRCSMPRSSWEYVESTSFSIVTKVISTFDWLLVSDVFF